MIFIILSLFYIKKPDKKAGFSTCHLIRFAISYERCASDEQYYFIINIK